MRGIPLALQWMGTGVYSTESSSQVLLMALIGISSQKQEMHSEIQSDTFCSAPGALCVTVATLHRLTIYEVPAASPFCTYPLGMQGAPAKLDASFGYSWQTFWAWWWPLAQSSLQCAAVRISAGLSTLSQQRFPWSASSYVNAMMSNPWLAWSWKGSAGIQCLAELCFTKNHSLFSLKTTTLKQKPLFG